MQRSARCRRHQSVLERRQRRTVPTKVFRERDRNRRAATVAAHRQRHGDWCPGFERAPHRTGDLTADHVHEQHDGGAWDGPLEVLCRSCNSRKHRRTQLRRASDLRKRR